MNEYDEKDWGIEIARCDDGDLLISQGESHCGCGDEILVRLHRAHFPLIAEYMGFIPAVELPQATERLHDRLNLMAAMVNAHTTPDSPLRAACAAIVGCAAPVAPEAQKPVQGPLIEPQPHPCGTNQISTH